MRNWHYMHGRQRQRYAEIGNRRAMKPFPQIMGLIVEALLKNLLKSSPGLRKVRRQCYMKCRLGRREPPVPQAKMERANIYFYLF